MVIFGLLISVLLIISAVAIKIYVVFRYFKQEENALNMSNQSETLSVHHNLNEKEFISDAQKEEIIQQYKKSESARRLTEEKEALWKLRDLKILSDKEFNEKMSILEDLHKCGKI
ncbi:hypothetical protein JHL18_06885 [Clostridium sp. YIM B02505]|uniref:SHOCT domain-containing protein n=1 Tax=Clostridium yunnanense TaxID=2800325 RepID=A0ABS1EM22_9CLOT|nr:hypothetical protein [Clostridium yunnanense]MBK1810358.1 hypothetical protein [Clostridium yunnanense]